jgi:aminoglycoside/choline kinase family phosphotransferase
MAQIATKHNRALTHHVDQAVAWLEQSGEGSSTSALSYAALELRYGIERLAIHYWYALLGRPLKDGDLRDTASFKTLEGKIYELAGHQQKIEAHFQFMRVFMSELKIEVPLETPQIGQLSSAWHDCSEVCHVGWPLASDAPNVASITYARLGVIAGTLKKYVASLGWPVLSDPTIVSLRDKFVTGKASADDIRAHMRNVGVWAKVDYPDGKPSHFIGEAIPPEAPESKS